jgi:hypothetical protein
MKTFSFHISGLCIYTTVATHFYKSRYIFFCTLKISYKCLQYKLTHKEYHCNFPCVPILFFSSILRLLDYVDF